MVLLFSLFFILILVFFLVNSFKKGIYITAINIIVILAIVDVYIPAIMGSITGRYYSLPYDRPMDDSEAVNAILIEGFALLLLFIGYYITSIKNKVKDESRYYIKKKTLFVLFLGSVLFYFLNMYFEIQSMGNLLDFYDSKVNRAYMNTSGNQTALGSMVYLISEIVGPIRLITLSIVIINKDQFSFKERAFVYFFTFLVPVFGLLRGSFANIFVCIMASYEYISRNKVSRKNLVKKIKYILIAGVSVFIVYGGIRSMLSDQNLEGGGSGSSFSENMVETLQGSVGPSLFAIVSSYRYQESHPLFWGQSYGEMLMFVVPRSILPNKPKVYGIQTLNIAKGYPEITMDAITMPGEAIMNFGILGLLIMLLWGVAFRFIDGFKRYPRMKYYLAASIFAIASTSNWMSFTGFFAQTKYMIITYLLLTLVIKKRSYSTK